MFMLLLNILATCLIKKKWMPQCDIKTIVQRQQGGQSLWMLLVLQ